MKKLILICMVILSAFCFADNIEKNLILEFGRGHIGEYDDCYNNNPSMVGIELKKNDNSIILFNMINSQYRDSQGLIYNHYININKSKFSLILGTGIITGYSNKALVQNWKELEGWTYPVPSTLICEGVALDIHLGLEYKVNNDISISGALFGNCLDLILKIKL